MLEPQISNVTLTDKGQIILSNKARKQLGSIKGASLSEIIMGNCVILMPRNQALNKIRKDAQRELENAGVTVDELKAEVERIKDERLAERYPNLADGA